ncbi:MAG TPA: HipA N-terminal domain-containing protein [Spirochaetota bacterium]|nr:HipA N-terminal domain-containing protein [Spirochaetota bacterium]HOR45917.1 HipA N-terminal domain-containing protein [Spirochaetota bacterium]HOU85258.1 HipA N-terminal domain-containing protein [Spirochaetota bacterium]HPK57643.1 HipA N-terminal domain-containing protein [Spirochaetota bacterium]HQE58472.1 HipA N-terminal domain-containing protein [Spirochaetota bacterium]
MNRTGKVFVNGVFAGILEENDSNYIFKYNENYLSLNNPFPVSLTMPPRKEPYTSRFLHPFFDGLIPEGWLLDIAERNWKIDQHDRMGLLLSVCRDCIGDVHVEPSNGRVK